MSTNTPTTPDQLEQRMFALINSFRATKSLPPYTWNATVANVSRAHSVMMGTGCGLSHQCPGEPDPFQRLTNAGISWQAAA